MLDGNRICNRIIYQLVESEEIHHDYSEIPFLEKRF